VSMCVYVYICIYIYIFFFLLGPVIGFSSNLHSEDLQCLLKYFQKGGEGLLTKRINYEYLGSTYSSYQWRGSGVYSRFEVLKAVLMKLPILRIVL
jgi:hypothetical protein